MRIAPASRPAAAAARARRSQRSESVLSSDTADSCRDEHRVRPWVAFVDPSSMPGWLEPVADANPFTIVTNAARALYNGNPVGNDAYWSILWSVGIIAVFAALSIRKFNQSTVA